MCGITGNSSLANIKGFLLINRQILKHYSAEIGLFQGFFISYQRPLHMFVHGDRIVQNR